MAIRSPLWRQHVFMLCKGDADSHDQCEHWSRNDSGCLGLLFLFPSALVSPLATPFPSVSAGDCLAAAEGSPGLRNCH